MGQESANGNSRADRYRIEVISADSRAFNRGLLYRVRNKDGYIIGRVNSISMGLFLVRVSLNVEAEAEAEREELCKAK